MFAPILFSIMALVIPLLILRSFSQKHKIYLAGIIIAHLIMMYLLHFRLVKQTGYPIVVDIHNDCQTYFDNTRRFSSRAPFGVGLLDAREAAEGSNHFGYQYVLAVMWTISSHPALAVRLFKTMLFFVGLSFVTLVWRRNYGARLAFGGCIFLGLFFTPAFYYNYRNLKDGLILALFLFIMALLDTLIQPRTSPYRIESKFKVLLGWLAVIILLYFLSTLRMYIPAIIVVALILHTVMSLRIEMQRRLALIMVLSVIIYIAFASAFMQNMMEMGGVSRISLTTFLSMRTILQAFLSPIPWGTITYYEPMNVFFYSIYWLLLPFALYCLIRHLISNLDWHFFLYLMITYTVGVVIGDPPRKRLIVYPVLVMWAISHLAYRRSMQAAQQEFEYQINEQQLLYNSEYYREGER